MEGKGEELPPHIKDPQTKPKWGKIEGGRCGWLGLGAVLRGKSRQLYLNNNKKFKTEICLFSLHLVIFGYCKYSVYPNHSLLLKNYF